MSLTYAYQVLPTFYFNSRKQKEISMKQGGRLLTFMFAIFIENIEFVMFMTTKQR